MGRDKKRKNKRFRHYDVSAVISSYQRVRSVALSFLYGAISVCPAPTGNRARAICGIIFCLFVLEISNDCTMRLFTAFCKHRYSNFAVDLRRTRY